VRVGAEIGLRRWRRAGEAGIVDRDAPGIAGGSGLGDVGPDLLGELLLDDMLDGRLDNGGDLHHGHPHGAATDALGAVVDPAAVLGPERQTVQTVPRGRNDHGDDGEPESHETILAARQGKVEAPKRVGQLYSRGMTEYRPPLRDIKFALEHVADLAGIAGLPGYEHVDPEDVYDGLAEAGRFLAEVVAPTNPIGDAAGVTREEDGTVAVPDEFVAAYRHWVDAGWGAVKGDPEYGGHGFPGVMTTAIQEMLTSSNLSFSLCPMLTASAVEALAHHGTDELKAIYLEKLITGEWSGTMALTEPEAGSDVGALRAKAWQADDGTWRVQGTKIFITWGEHEMAENIIHFVLARAPGAPPGTKGISLFLIPKLLVDADGSVGAKNDVECVGVEDKLGIHASPTCVMAYGAEDGAVAYLVGEVHRGMHCMFTMMNDARLHVGLQGLGLTVRSYERALDYAVERRQGRAIGAPKDQATPIVEHPDVRRMLLTMKAHIDAMRGLILATSAAGDRSAHGADEATRIAAANRAALLTPVAKAWCTDVGVEMTSLGIQIHGGMGYIEETGAAQYWRDSRIAPIYEGTNGIQAIDLVLRKLPLDGGAVVKEYLGEMEAAAVELQVGGGQLGLIGGNLERAVAALRETTDWLLAAADPNDVLAGAVPYLRQFGVVAGGYYLGRLAAAAAAELDSGEDRWLQAKIDVAAFYAAQFLPTATGAAAAVTAGAAPLYALDLESLAI
jgi:alkylation response protein AidB-like acyl-CoA dehydrogenase